MAEIYGVVSMRLKRLLGWLLIAFPLVICMCGVGIYLGYAMAEIVLLVIVTLLLIMGCILCIAMGIRMASE